ncbi:hypothetical protein KUCAC02_035008, partial [Chaenocephalus aceratus]
VHAGKNIHHSAAVNRMSGSAAKSLADGLIPAELSASCWPSGSLLRSGGLEAVKAPAFRLEDHRGSESPNSSGLYKSVSMQRLLLLALEGNRRG